MKKINELYSRKPREIKIIQFGEGNFLKPISYGDLDRFHAQDNLYTVSLRGKMNGETYEENRVITSVEKVLDIYQDYEEYTSLARLDSLEFVVSNTTEAGIVYDAEDQFELDRKSVV